MKRIYSKVSALLAANDAFAGVDLKHYDNMKELLAANILHATDHGDCVPLNDLYRKVSNGTKEIIRIAIGAINKHFSDDNLIGETPYLLFDFKSRFTEEGPNKSLPTFFFRKEIKQNGDLIAQYIDEKGNPIKEARQIARKAISAVDEPTLARLMDEEQQRRNETSFTPYDADGKLVNMIKSAAKVHGMPKSDLVALNKMISNKDKRLNIDQLWQDGAEPLAALKAEVERKQAIIAKEEAKRHNPVENDNEPVANEPEAIAAAG